VYIQYSYTFFLSFETSNDILAVRLLKHFCVLKLLDSSVAMLIILRQPTIMKWH